MVHVEWGDVPSYFGGLALLVTIGIVSRDRREKERLQADRVAAWATRNDSGFQLFVRNASDLPVSRAAIYAAAGATGFDKDGSLVVSLSKFDSEGGVRNLKPRYVDVIGPGETTEVFAVDLDRGPLAVRSFEFVDAAGRSWRRDLGTLRVVKNRGVRKSIRQLLRKLLAATQRIAQGGTQ
jgi:hypothetical protein